MHPRGAVGVVIQAPADYWHSYRVRFLDGFEASFSRQELAILSQYQTGSSGTDVPPVIQASGTDVPSVILNHGRDGHATSPTDPLAEYDLYGHVIYRCIIGSRAYGLDHADSDTDRRGVYLPPADLHWSLYGVPGQLENDDTQEVYWEIQKFITLALKANPNVLECLYTPLVEHATPLAQELLAMRAGFLSKMVYQTYSGYVASQFKKLQSDLRNKGQVKWKHVMHLLRLLLSGVTVLKEGYVPVRVEELYRDRLLAIKRGEVVFEEADAWRLSLHREFDEAFEKTTLPDRPDYEKANELLVRARRSVV